MTQNTGKDVQALQREVEELRRALQQKEDQLKKFGEGLSELNTGMMSLMDKHFDGNVYRNALEHSFKEHVYTKIRNLFGAIALIAGLGGFVFVNYTIEKMVKDTIKEQQGEFVQASENLTRERLAFLLRELKRSEPEHLARRAEEIQKEPRFLPHLEEFIRVGSDPLKQELAIHYAGVVRERELLEPIFEVLEDRKSPEARVRALNTLIRYLPNPRVAERIKETLEAENLHDSPLWLELTRVLGVETYKSPNARAMADSLMRQALKSTRPEVFRGAVLFYLVNNDLWKPDYAGNLVSTKYAELIVSPKPGFLKSEIDRAPEGSYAREQLVLMEGYVALAQLRKGQREHAEQVLLPNAPSKRPVFAQAVWDHTVKLFPDFEPSAQLKDGPESKIRLEPMPEELRKQQEELWSRLEYYRWDESRKMYVFEDPQETSIAELRRGETASMEEYLSVDYYDSTRWREVLDLFPRFRDEYQQEDLYGEPLLQDILLSELPYYAWDENQQVFVYQDPQDPSIAALKKGDFQLMAEFLEVDYYDAARWEEVLSLFPEFREDHRDSLAQDPYYFQDLLASRLSDYEWDQTRRQYHRATPSPGS